MNLKDDISNTIDLDDEEVFEDFVFSDVAYSHIGRMEQPPFGGFNPNFPGSGFNPIFPGGNQPPNVPPFNIPGGGFNQNPQNMQLGAPPSHIPSKSDKGVQSFSSGQGGPQSKFVSPNSIRFCLFKFTYIWERGGRNYWSFLTRVDNRTVSGFRWLGRRWVYFGVDLRRIDSFVCYRSDCENCDYEHSYTRPTIEESKKEYSTSLVRDVYCKTLYAFSMPEIKNETVLETIGVINGRTVETSVPCTQSRTTNYRIVLEVSYPESFSDAIKEEIIKFADESSNENFADISHSRDSNKYLNPLEIFNKSSNIIEESLRNFSSDLSLKLQTLSLWQDTSRSINCTIRQEKISDDWKSYY